MQTAPIVKDLVLVGGGHSHLEVLKRFGMRPLAGARITLICKDLDTPYSGMLPGFIAGHYAFDETHIDLGPLAHFAGARLLNDEVVGVDVRRQLVICRARPPVPYDVLSVNTGSTPDTLIDGAAEFAVAVKPISSFHAQWLQMRTRILAAGGKIRVAVVGGGAGGVEILLAARHNLMGALRAHGHDADRLAFVLITASSAILPTHNARVRQKFEQLLRENAIDVITGERVKKVEAGVLRTRSGRVVGVDETLWVTTASAPRWLQEAGVETDEAGFIRVNDSLQSISHPMLFAAGDVAAVDLHPRPKSGTFAVRQGRPLAANLRRALLGEPPKPFVPQREFLSLISTGRRHAIASRGVWALEGRWVWRWKDWIDRRFMAKYSRLPEMADANEATDPPDLIAAHDLRLAQQQMRCGGCGSKVGANMLADALRELAPYSRDDVLIGLHDADDAAVVAPPPERVAVHTVDAFRAFIDDPYIFGKVTAAHCLSDIFAMGAVPQSALALVTLPLAAESKMRDDLVQIMSGALEVLAAEKTALVGGHTTEGDELSLGFAINGYARREDLTTKADVRAGQRLILTKALGTGVLFAAHMRGKAKARWIDSGLRSMVHSNRAAAQCLRDYGATAITDLTGFGLVGHAAEMLRDGGVKAELSLARLPLLVGAEALAEQGYVSSLYEQNLAIRNSFVAGHAVQAQARFALCFDPQTAGGLLAAVPTENAADCIVALVELGYAQAANIGGLSARNEHDQAPPIRLEL